MQQDTEDLKIKDITIPNLRPSFPVELFNGIHCSTFICERKNRVFLRKYEPFSNLTLAVTSMSSNMEVSKDDLVMENKRKIVKRKKEKKSET